MNKHNSRPIGIVLPGGCRAVHGTAASIKEPFNFTPLVMHELNSGNSGYAQALIDGAGLADWHQRPDWQSKTDKAVKSAVRSFSPQEIALEDRKRKTAERMAHTAFDTATQSGAVSQVEQKDKCVRFVCKEELAAYARELMESQKGLCALTGLPMLLDGMEGDDQLR
jgi:hypothetical protein